LQATKAGVGTIKDGVQQVERRRGKVKTGEQRIKAGTGAKGDKNL